MSSALKIRSLLEKERFGLTICMVAKLTKPVKLNPLLQLSAHSQFTCKQEESPIARNGNMSLLVITMVMLQFLTTTIFQRELLLYTNLVSGARSWHILQMKSSWQLVLTMIQYIFIKLVRMENTLSTGQLLSYILRPLRVWIGVRTRST